LVFETVGEYQQAMLEFASLGNLSMWYLHLDPAGMQARWGASVKPKAMKILEADFAQAYHRDNLRAFEKLTTRVNGKLQIVAHPPLVVPIEDLLPDSEKDKFEQTMRGFISNYRASLQPDRRRLIENFQFAHIARKVVGVGSVGSRAWIVLLLGRDDRDPLFLQAKEAQTSVLEPYLPKSVYSEQGKRVVEGQRLMQAASDIFLGWERVSDGLDGQSHDFYLRQLWDWKISADIDIMSPAEMLVYVKMCAWTLARAHARSGDRIAIAAYLGNNDEFEKALVEFADLYADQNERDYQVLVEAVKGGQIKAQTGI